MAKTRVGKLNVQASDFNNYSLDDYLRDSEYIPINVFKKTDTAQAIRDGIQYITTAKFGTLVVPPIDNNKPLLISANIDSNGLVKINYTYQNYRFPVNSETRPYTNDAWQVGDRIINKDTAKSKSEGWVCVTSGTPGEWKAITYYRNWASQVETVDTLPDANKLMEGRQLLCKDKATNIVYCYICTTNNQGQYAWLRQNNLSNEDIFSRVDSLFNQKFSGNVIKAISGLLVNPTITDLDNPHTPENVSQNFPPYQIPKATSTSLGGIKASNSILVDSSSSVKLYNEIQRNTQYKKGDLLIHPKLHLSKVLECINGGTTAATEPQAYQNLSLDAVDNTLITDGTCSFSAYDNRWERRRKRIVDLIYPVGSIYMSTTNANPGTLFGGQWEPYGQGKVLVGAGNATPLGDTGGVSSYQLSINQLPSHTHAVSIKESGGHTHKTRFQNDDYNGSTSGGVGLIHDGTGAYIEHNDNVLSAGNHSHEITIGNTGEGKHIDNMPPYIVVSIWRRLS